MFFSKNKGPEVTDVIFLSEQGFTNAIVAWLEQSANGIVGIWFRNDLEKLRHALSSIPEDRFVLTDRLAYSASTGRPVLFAGHYPIRAAEATLCESLAITDMLVYTHLDMPLLKVFGSERIKELMIKMGMKEDEPLNHPMITKAISNAQDRIEKKSIAEIHAPSEEDWFKMNLPGL